MEHPLARQAAQDADGAHQLGGIAFLAHDLAALALEGQHDAIVFQRDIRLQKRGGAAGAVETGVGFIARTDRGARDQFDHRRKREFAGRGVALEVLRDVAANFRKRRDQPRQPVGLAVFADLFPVGMIAILQPPRGIAADRLQMRVGIGRIADIGIGRGHRHRVEPSDGPGVADRPAVGANE